MSRRSVVKRLPSQRTVLASAVLICLACGAQAQLGPVPTGGQFLDLGSLGGGSTYISSTGQFNKSISQDGSVVVGYSRNTEGMNRPFRWTLSDGMQDIGSISEGGYTYIRGISQNGSVLVGQSEWMSGGMSQTRPFRWTATGGIQNLGTLGGTYGYANGVSADGSVVVGYATTANDLRGRAFRWTSDTGVMQDLGTLGGDNSYAHNVSGDGSTVVGSSPVATHGNDIAFRWTAADGMQNLGTLGGSWSVAYGVSANGSVVVGQSNTSTGQYHAFRWTEATGMSDLGTLGGHYSTIMGMTPSGAVIVGESTIANDGGSRAFRWTSTTGMVNLGTLGGSWSQAHDVSDAGDIVVGRSHSPETEYEAFRWTEAGGMQSVGEWLQDNGVAVAEGWSLADGGEVAISGDGQVIVGNGRDENNERAVWFARATGAVTLQDVSDSLGATSGGVQQVVSATNTVLNGAHSRPLDRRVAPGQKTFWLAGDWGTDDHQGRQGRLGLAELGLGHNLGRVQWNIALGQTWARQDMGPHGTLKMDGTYLLAEALVPVKGALWTTFSAYTHRGEADIQRGYLNAGTPDTSRGSPAVDTWAVRVRLEWDRLWEGRTGTASPYVDMSHTHSRMKAYTETGGGFPARFDARSDRSTEMRLGLNLAHPLTDTVSLVGTVEAAHRLESHGARSRGEVLGLFSFDLEGERNQRNWWRLGVGLNGTLVGGSASVLVNFTTQSAAPSAWLAMRWQRAF